ATPTTYTLSLHDALPIWRPNHGAQLQTSGPRIGSLPAAAGDGTDRVRGPGNGRAVGRADQVLRLRCRESDFRATLLGGLGQAGAVGQPLGVELGLRTLCRAHRA